MSQSTSTASISSDEAVSPVRPVQTTSDAEALPRKMQLIYHGVDKGPEPFPPPISPSEQLSNGLPTQIKTGTSARASLPTEIWDMVFSNVERWQERKDLTQAWTSIRCVCRGFKAAVERIFKEEHAPKLILHMKGDYCWNKHYDTFVISKIQRFLAAEAARYPDRFHGEIPRNSDDAQHTCIWTRRKELVFKRIDDCAPRRVVLGDLSTNDNWSWLAFRRLSELATGQDDFCLGSLGDPPTSEPETWDSIVLGQEHLKSQMQSLYSNNIIAADPAARLDVITQVRDIMNDCALPDLWINYAEGEISFDWHALCCRVYGEEKALTDMLTIIPVLAQDAYVAWMERVDQQCLRLPPWCLRGNVEWQNQNNEKRRKIWLAKFLNRQKNPLYTWRETMRKQCRRKDTAAQGRDRLTSEHLLQKYSADLEIRFDKDSSANVIIRDPPLPPKLSPWDDHTPLGKDLMPKAHWDHEYRTNAAILERTRFLERRTKRERHEVTEQAKGYFRLSHYDSAEMPPCKRLKTNQGIAFCQDLPKPYPMESLIGINTDWAREAWQEVQGHELPYERILNSLPQRLTRYTYITDGVELLFKSWERHYAKMPIAPPVYVRSVEFVKELLHAYLERTSPRRDSNDRHKRTPRSILKGIHTCPDDNTGNVQWRYNPFATIDVSGQSAEDGRTEGHAIAPTQAAPMDGQRKVKESQGAESVCSE